MRITTHLLAGALSNTHSSLEWMAQAYTASPCECPTQMKLRVDILRKEVSCMLNHQKLNHFISWSGVLCTITLQQGQTTHPTKSILCIITFPKIHSPLTFCPNFSQDFHWEQLELVQLCGDKDNHISGKLQICSYLNILAVLSGGQV